MVDSPFAERAQVLKVEVNISFVRAQLTEYAADKQRMVVEGVGVLEAVHLIVVCIRGVEIKDACK